jgi:hypothetical protein
VELVGLPLARRSAREHRVIPDLTRFAMALAHFLVCADQGDLRAPSEGSGAVLGSNWRHD